MNALVKIRNAGFELWLKDNGNIGIRPFDALTPQQLAFLKVHKSEIIEALAANEYNPISELEDNPPRLTTMDKTVILRWLHSIDETDEAAIQDILQYCASNPEALAYYLKRAEEIPPQDDRHHCRECLNLRNGYCIKQQFRPVDDIPRRCEDFRAATLNDSRSNP